MEIENKNNPEPRIVGIRFSKIGKNYYFDAKKINQLSIGDFLVVETSRGWQIGEIVEIITDPKIINNASYKHVDRLATEEDLKRRGELIEKGNEVQAICTEEIKKLKISGFKVISAEYSFDFKNISILYSSLADETPNLNRLKNEVGKRIQNTKIDFHKIGPRDVAKYYGGMGACGFDCRCCTRFITRFESISIRMAKKQGISLTPTDITGMCDRLRCCLGYEYCQYVEALKNMPKRNKIVNTPKGKGKIKDVAPMRNTVFVQIDDIGVKEFNVDEIEEISIIPIQKNPQKQYQKNQKILIRKNRSQNRK